MPCGEDEGESALASYRCTEAVFPVAGMVRLHERRAFYGEEPCASASGLIWWASDWLRALWAEHETLLNGEGDSGRLCWLGSSC